MPPDSTDADDAGTLELLAREAEHVFEPIVRAAKAAENGDFERLEFLLDESGIDRTALGDTFDLLVDTLSDVVTVWETIEGALEGDGSLDADELAEVLESIKDLVATIRTLDDLEVDVDDDAGTAVGERIVDYLLVRYLRWYHWRTYNACCLLGVILEGEDGAPDDLRLSTLGDVLEDPNGIPKELFGWGTEDFRGAAIVYYLGGLLEDPLPLSDLGPPSDDVSSALELPTPPDDTPSEGWTTPDGTEADYSFGEQVDWPAVPPSDAVTADRDGFDRADLPEALGLRVPVLYDRSGDELVEFGFEVVSVPGTAGKQPGVGLVPYGEAAAGFSADITSVLTFEASASTDVTVAIVCRPDGTELVPVEGDAGTSVAEFHGEASLSYDPSAGGSDETVVLGQPDGTRLSYDSFGVEVAIDVDGKGTSVRVGLPVDGVLAIDPDDLGGFLSKVLPADGIDYDFDVTVGWASDGGLYLDNGGTLEAALPQNASLGPITLDEIYLGVTPAAEDADLHVVGATSATVELGPVTGSVRRMGVSADVNFVGGGDGNFGPVDVDLGFEPPSGIAVSIDSGGVTGGGFLNFEPERGRYSGGLQLSIGDISINAVGLLTTELPGGEDGFSLLVLITAQDLGIQLGMGLTLEGIGGLVGIHRSMQPEPLAEAVRTGTLDSVLFPTDVVANAQRIVSDLRAIFPPTKGEHVVGPMVKLGWGSPTLIEADLGIVLQIPTVKIAILGRVSTQLPDEEAPIVVLNMEALGLILPAERRASMEAHLFDSRVTVFTLTGGMAMVSRWGDDPAFILTVGGFHPAFDPPDDVPHVDRLAISLSKGSNFKFEVRGYFAVTSNTLQTGAHVEVFVGKGKWGVRGFLGFDALFRWDPEFKFVADFEAGVEITPIGLSLTVEGHLEGPGPWHVRGKVKFSLVFVTVKISVSATIGEEAGPDSLPTAKVMPELSEAVVDPANWDAQRPGGTTAIATFRELEPSDDRILAHPLGRLAVRQTVVPLSQDGRDVVIDTFGNARPGDYRQFRIEHAGAGGLAEGDRDGTVQDHFAPAQFLELSDAEKLERESFERLPAGRALGTRGAHVPEAGDFATATRRTTLDYETSVVDETEDNYRTPLLELGELAGSRPEVARIGLLPREVRAQLEVGSVAAAPSRTDGGAAYRPRPELEGPDPVAESVDEPVAEPGADLSGAISVRNSSYVVAETDALETAEIGDTPPRMTRVEAEQAFRQHVAETPGASEDLHVTGEHHVASDGGAGP